MAIWTANFNLFLDNVAVLFPGLKRETLKSFNDLSAPLSENNIPYENSQNQGTVVNDLENKLEDILEIRRNPSDRLEYEIPNNLSQKIVHLSKPEKKQQLFVDGMVSDNDATGSESQEVNPSIFPDYIMKILGSFNEENEKNLAMVVEFMENMKKEEILEMRLANENLRKKCDDDEIVMKGKVDENKYLKSLEKDLKEKVERLEGETAETESSTEY